MSIAGGVGNAFLHGKKVECDAIQIFTKSSRQWAGKPYSKEEIEQFHANRKDTGITKVIAHDSYLLNLGSPDAALRLRSIEAFIDELERCEVLGVTHLVAHPGAHVGAGEVEGIKTIARSLDEVHKACPGYRSQSHLGNHRRARLQSRLPFQQIADIIDATHESDRLRVCFDTEHAFAAGYDLRTEKATSARSANSTKRSASNARGVSSERLKKGVSIHASIATSTSAKGLSASMLSVG